ncbi:hypothetical protein DFS34DRAFT_651490 [Phlyctochytrium arcticum]|nr:hypothetical protein DFS34DRAFT_651490 [Phlyctochytrium arcticum]
MLQSYLAEQQPFTLVEFAKRGDRNAGCDLAQEEWVFYLFSDGSSRAENTTYPSNQSADEAPTRVDLSPTGASVTIYHGPVFTDGNHSYSKNVGPSTQHGRSRYFFSTPPKKSVTLHTVADGAKRFLTAHVPSEYRSRVVELLDFRNNYHDLPYLHASLMEASELQQTLQTNSPITCSRWSSDGVSEDRRVIHSIDKITSITLSSHRQYFTVRYPAAVADPENTVSVLKGGSKRYQHTYLWIEQSFSCHDVPQYWTTPLAMLTEPAKSITSSYVTTALPKATSFSSPTDRRDLDPRSSHQKRLKVMWTPTALYRVLPARTTNDLHYGREIEATLHIDGSVMRSSEDFRFITLYHGQGSGTETYAIPNAPPYLTSSVSGLRYPFALITSEMLPIYQSHCMRSSSDQTDSSQIDSGITAVIKSELIPGLGAFTIFEPAGVRALFEDGTTLETDESGSIASVQIAGESDMRIVRCANPIGCEKYVAAATRYSAQARESPKRVQERVGRMKKGSAMVENSIKRSQRFLKASSTYPIDPGTNIPDIIRKNQQFLSRLT